MLGLLLLVSSLPQTTDLDAVYAKVRTLKGIHVQGEMVRPSVIAMEFKATPDGYMWAKYPTSEQFISPTESITWMPDRREYAKSKPEDLNPLPGGFEALWPGQPLLKQNGSSKSAKFADKDAVEIPCDGSNGVTIRLFVSPETLLPMGTIAKSNNMEFEMRYKSVSTAPIDPKSVRFVPPKDARPYVNRAPDANLIKPGALLKEFAGKDAAGKSQSMKALLKGGKGALINFWFTSCTGCIQEMPYLSKLEKRLRTQKISVLGVNGIDGADAVLRTSKTNNLDYPTLIGAPAKTLSQQVGIIAYPVTIVVDAKGTVIDTVLGFNQPRIEKALGKIGALL